MILPLFPNAQLATKVPGVSPSCRYELMHKPDLPVLKIASRMAVPKKSLSRGQNSTQWEVLVDGKALRPSGMSLV